jgi:adenylate cyclase
MHTGPLTAGVLGTLKFSYDVWGVTLDYARELAIQAETGRIHISESARQLLSKEQFEPGIDIGGPKAPIGSDA